MKSAPVMLVTFAAFHSWMGDIPSLVVAQFESEESSQAECDLVCENGGTCAAGTGDELFDRYDGMDLPFLEKTQEEEIQQTHCVCPPGYIGHRCEVELAPCGDDYQFNGVAPPKHACFNGASCKVEISDSGEEFYYCDCSEAGTQDPFSFAGRMCEHASSVFCGQDDPDQSKHTFCTNGGTCIDDNTKPTEEHKGCRCPDEWEGLHCQYRKGTSPRPDQMEVLPQPKENAKQSKGSREGHLAFLLIITVVCVSSALLILAVMREVHKDMARSSTQEAVVTNTPIRPSPSFADSERGQSPSPAFAPNGSVSPVLSLGRKDPPSHIVDEDSKTSDRSEQFKTKETMELL